jgi:hypothetical protein
MWYVIAAVILIGASSAYGLSRGRWGGPSKSPAAGDHISYSDMGDLSIEEVNVLLARLESEEPPEPVMGAMCYAAMAIPATAEYVCPVCGEKTLYSGYVTELVEWELPAMRRMTESVDSLTEFRIFLDESQFCSFCSEEEHEDPLVLLRVVLEDGTETVNPVSITDLRMLESFLQGRLSYMTFNDSEQPLREHADRIRTLMGLAE